jgi:hypothetical protein
VNKRNLLLMVMLSLVLTFLLFGGGPATAEKLAGITNLDQLFLSASSTTPTLKVNQSGTGDIVQFQDGGVEVFSIADGGALTMGTWGQWTAQTAISVTHDGIITPTGTYQQLESADAVGTSNVAAGSAGQLLVLVNTTNTTITISDTGTLKLSSDAALGQYDSLTLISDGTNWVELAQADN